MRLSKKLVAVAIVATAAITATAAFAYWTSTGTGAASATAGGAATWDIAADPADGDLLSPGGPTDTIDFHVTNNGSGHQKLQSVDISVANIGGTAWSVASTTTPSCTKDDFSVGGKAAGVTHTVLPAIDLAPGATYDGSVTVQMLNGSGNQDACKGVTVPLYFDAK